MSVKEQESDEGGAKSIKNTEVKVCSGVVKLKDVSVRLRDPVTLSKVAEPDVG